MSFEEISLLRFQRRESKENFLERKKEREFFFSYKFLLINPPCCCRSTITTLEHGMPRSKHWRARITRSSTAMKSRLFVQQQLVPRNCIDELVNKFYIHASYHVVQSNVSYITICATFDFPQQVGRERKERNDGSLDRRTRTRANSFSLERNDYNRNRGNVERQDRVAQDYRSVSAMRSRDISSPFTKTKSLDPANSPSSP